MTKLKTIIKMAKIGYKLGYNCNFPLTKTKRKNDFFFFFLRNKHTHTGERETWLQLMATTLTKKINMTIILKI